MSFPLYIDEDSMSKALVGAMRRNGINVSIPADVNMKRATDIEQLEYAANTGRVIYTSNIKHFSRLHAQFLSQAKPHAGIIVVTQQRFSIGEQVRRLAHLMENRSADDMRNQLEYLSNW